MTNIIHYITGLNVGGAEMMLYKLLKYANRDAFKHQVVCLGGEGKVGGRIQALGIEVTYLKLNKMKHIIPSAFKLFKINRNVDIIQCWMYHANLLGYLINLRHTKKLIWGIRQSRLIPKKNKRLTIWIDKLCARLSHKKPLDLIISCSEAAAFNHCNAGYVTHKMKVVYNGFETQDYFRLKDTAREAYGIPSNTPVLVSAGRWNYIKDYPTLVEACARLKAQHIDFMLVLCGEGMTENNTALMEIIHQHQLEENIRLMGRRDDLVHIFSISDIYVSSSLVEGFSNAIGEAMLCELPCVVTDVGDSALIVGDTGYIVEPMQSDAICDSILKLLQISNEKKKILGEAARRRIQKNFDICSIVKRFEDEYRKLLI